MQGARVFTGTDIGILRVIALKAMLQLEIWGMKRRGRSAYFILKEELGLEGDKASVLEQVQEYISAAAEIMNAQWDKEHSADKGEK
jgi:hypothetical protein